MKRILNILLAAALLVSAVPTAFAADSSEGTDIVMTGTYATETYTVTVPAQLAPGKSGEVVLKGGWSPNKTVKVSCPNSVTLTYEGQTIDVGISFPGITQAGSMDDAINRVETISVESKSVAFGTWTGHLAYTVEIVEEANLISFTIDDNTFQTEPGMNWYEWVNSDYNTAGFSTRENSINGGVVASDFQMVASEDGNFQYGADVIIEGHNYYCAD